MKQIKIGEWSVLEFRAELFHIFNHPTSIFRTAVVGTASFGQIFKTYGRTLGLGTSRQMQMALKLRFQGIFRNDEDRRLRVPHRRESSQAAIRNKTLCARA